MFEGIGAVHSSSTAGECWRIITFDCKGHRSQPCPEDIILFSAKASLRAPGESAACAHVAWEWANIVAGLAVSTSMAKNEASDNWH